MADTPERFAAKTFKKQGLNPHPAGQPPRAGSEGFITHDTDINDASGHKLETIDRPSGDDLGGSGPLHPSVLSQMINKYAANADAAATAAKYGGK